MPTIGKKKCRTSSEQVNSSKTQVSSLKHKLRSFKKAIKLKGVLGIFHKNFDANYRAGERRRQSLYDRRWISQIRTNRGAVESRCRRWQAITRESSRNSNVYKTQSTFTPAATRWWWRQKREFGRYFWVGMTSSAISWKASEQIFKADSIDSFLCVQWRRLTSVVRSFFCFVSSDKPNVLLESFKAFDIFILWIVVFSFERKLRLLKEALETRKLDKDVERC